jgi:hypothetical protein
MLHRQGSGWFRGHDRNRIATASATAPTTSTTSGALRRAAGKRSRLKLEDLEHHLRAKLEALGPAVRAELLRVLMLPDFDRARRIGDFYAEPRSRTFAELLIDCEEDPNARSVVIGMLREEELRG